MIVKWFYLLALGERFVIGLKALLSVETVVFFLLVMHVMVFTCLVDPSNCMNELNLDYIVTVTLLTTINIIVYYLKKQGMLCLNKMVMKLILRHFLQKKILTQLLKRSRYVLIFFLSSDFFYQLVFFWN